MALSLNWVGARAAVAAAALDVLVFADGVSEPMNYFLQFGRLAPVQALSACISFHLFRLALRASIFSLYMKAHATTPIQSDRIYPFCLFVCLSIVSVLGQPGDLGQGLDGLLHQRRPHGAAPPHTRSRGLLLRAGKFSMHFY